MSVELSEITTKSLRIAGKLAHSSVNGPGVRYVLFLQGCPHHCKGCQNPETHDPLGGEEMSAEAVLKEIQGTRYLDGVTFSGGDPLMQADALIPVLKGLREAEAPGLSQASPLSIWLYTGWTWEQILAGAAGEAAIRALKYLDVIVDGRFEESLSAAALEHTGAAPISPDTTSPDTTPQDTTSRGTASPDITPPDLKWRGSTNQRLIDVPKSLEMEQLVLFREDNTVL